MNRVGQCAGTNYRHTRNHRQLFVKTTNYWYINSLENLFVQLKRIFGKIVGSKWAGWPEQITNGLGWVGSKIDKINVYPMGMGWA